MLAKLLRILRMQAVGWVFDYDDFTRKEWECLATVRDALSEHRAGRFSCPFMKPK